MVMVVVGVSRGYGGATAHGSVRVQALEELRSASFVVCEETLSAFLQVGAERN